MANVCVYTGAYVLVRLCVSVRDGDLFMVFSTFLRIFPLSTRKSAKKSAKKCKKECKNTCIKFANKKCKKQVQKKVQTKVQTKKCKQKSVKKSAKKVQKKSAKKKVQAPASFLPACRVFNHHCHPNVILPSFCVLSRSFPGDFKVSGI